ncbi:hypothetical protein M378DRAFT_165879 [Amanita muscaria Koide BX008]|uniref:Uncharacterized protein n=1 Tax=Amanita muscaria (strain Koide BX008) TaxID=946122 RepID=A0A0C2WZN2_AMAMK|nr:hypothetical protein M378DRAFT_165879 [Amanita muscaria Koide BX008]
MPPRNSTLTVTYTVESRMNCSIVSNANVGMRIAGKLKPTIPSNTACSCQLGITARNVNGSVAP